MGFVGRMGQKVDRDRVNTGQCNHREQLGQAHIFFVKAGSGLEEARVHHKVVS